MAIPQVSSLASADWARASALAYGNENGRPYFFFPFCFALAAAGGTGTSRLIVS